MKTYLVQWKHDGIQQSGVCLQLQSPSEGLAIAKIRENFGSYRGTITIISISQV